MTETQKNRKTEKQEMRKMQGATALLLICCFSVFPLICVSSSAAEAPEGATPNWNAPPAADVTVEQPPADAVNLMVNPGFEEPNAAGDGPAHWQIPDGLVWKWTTDPDAPERGKVILIDTDVYQSDCYLPHINHSPGRDPAKMWWVRRYLHNAPLSDAPVKRPTSGSKYDTIAGLDGGFYLSDPIPIKEGRAYKVYVDVKGPGAKVFMFGYETDAPLAFGDESPAILELFREARGEPLVDKKGRQIRHYRPHKYRTWFTVGGDSSQWKTYTHIMPRHPTGRELTEDVRFIRIYFYPYWPPGEYWFDNVRVHEVDPVKENIKADADELDVEEGKVVK